MDTGLVRNIPLFSGLTEAEKDGLLKDGQFCSCPDKKFLFRSGDPITHFYVMCSGTVQMFHETPDGREITTDIRIAGDTIGVTGIFEDGDIHHTCALAINNVSVIKFSMEWLRKLVQENGRVSINLLSIISRHVSRLKIEAENQAKMSAMQIIGCFLQYMCVDHGLDKNGFVIPYSKSLIASRLGMERETLSRNLCRLKEAGITVKKRYIRFHDSEAIDRYICGHCSTMEKCHVYKKLRASN